MRRVKHNGQATLQKIRYGVIGLGYIAQAAVLPAFANAAKNSVLTALISGDPEKLKKLGKKYDVENTFSYDELDDALKSDTFDALYICLPNSQHHEVATKAAVAGINILCEKPLCVTEEECLGVIESARESKVKLMTAYRLHFDQVNLNVVDIVRSGKLGDPRVFHSVFTRQVKENNIRLQEDLGGGTLYDLGVYCINAARYLFRSEPTEVTALTARGKDKRFREIDEMTGAVLRFPGDRLALFVTSFGAAHAGWYEVIGTEGRVRVENSYSYDIDHELRMTIQDKVTLKKFKATDQFAPELLYFSDCILQNKQPEPSGEEGLADVRILRAIYQSAEAGVPIKLDEVPSKSRPVPSMTIRKPKRKEPELVHASD